jgi:transposase
MAKRNRRKCPAQPTMPAPFLQPNAAGIDIGATEIYVAVPPDRDVNPVRCFETFTPDLHALVDWLQTCGIRIVAMESTGVFWIPLFQILEGRGFEVCLVNARHVKNVPGRKTDVLDCQWLQYLHSVGLLHASFRPKQAVCAIRALLRHRDSLIQMSSQHIQHMQKALTQMNLQLHHVISDITGATGLAILDAIVAGQRDPHALAKLRDRRIKASAETVAKSLVGDYQLEHLFTLRQSLSAYRYHQQLIAECDSEIECQLERFETKVEPPTPSKKARTESKKSAAVDLGNQHWRIFGVDLAAVPGINSTTVSVLLAEVGPDWSKFRSASAFASWLGLCPHNEISGGQVLSSKTQKVNNRAATALRLAARSLHHSHSYLGEYYRRMRAKLGAPKAIVAAAHKLARILHHLVTSGQPYEESIFALLEIKSRQRAESRLQAHAKTLGLRLTPIGH